MARLFTLSQDSYIKNHPVFTAVQGILKKICILNKSGVFYKQETLHVCMGQLLKGKRNGYGG
jgi:hypothetical protein